MTILFWIFLTAPAFAKKNEPVKLWQEWYVYSLNGKAVGIYEETAERRPADKQVAIVQRWIETDGGLAETYIGSVAADDGKFTPVAFFRERKAGAETEKVDGRFRVGVLDVTVKSANAKLKPRKDIKIKPGTYLSNFVPLVLAARKPGSGIFSFDSVVEDVRDGGYGPRDAAAQVLNVTKKVRGLLCRKTEVDFVGVVEWWVAADGRTCEVKNPENGTQITLSTENEARKALGIK